MILWQCVSHSVVSDSLWPMDYRPLGSPVHGILQARKLKWIVIPFSRGSYWPKDQTWVSCTAGRFFTIWAIKEACDDSQRGLLYAIITPVFSICAVLSRSVLSDSLRPHGLQPTRLLCPWEFSREEYWSVLPCPPPGNLPNPGIEPASLASPALQAASLPTEPPGKPVVFSRVTGIWSEVAPSVVSVSLRPHGL